MSERKNILALYDCRSKQEYIYRTNKVKEITGGSELLTGLFKDFFRGDTSGFKINSDWETTQAPENYLEYFNESGLDGEIIYEGGGNLCVIYKDMDTYLSVNRRLSRQALEKAPGISIIASSTEVTGDFYADRKKLYAENALQKNLGPYHIPVNVLPFTEVDRNTYQPIVKKGSGQYTAEALKKKEKYDSVKKLRTEDKSDIIAYEFDDMTDKGNDSLLAVIYIDGNNMGAKVMKATGSEKSYSSGINALRSFSVSTNNDFVVKPIKAITDHLYEKWKTADETQKNRYLFRRIISGGDEITLICNAHAVRDILKEYFSTLTGTSDNSACAGVAVFHSHAPFADVYEIAEECCESGKKLSHMEGNQNKNYIDFHFCHAGITNDLETIRDRQECGLTERPYEYGGSWDDFERIGNMLSAVNRSDVKDLGEAIVKGSTYYKETLRKIKSGKKLQDIDEDDITVMRMIYDISIVFDIWFEKGGNISV